LKEEGEVRRNKEERRKRRVTITEARLRVDDLLKTRRRYEVTLVAGDNIEFW
jgi:hypothetical protein